MAHLFMTGGTGFIGRRLCQLALDQGMEVSVLSRKSSQQVKALCGASVRSITAIADLSSLPPIDHVINLAGEPILGKRWSSKRKQILRESRIELTHQLVNNLARLPNKPATLISGSAIGIYGDTGEHSCSETQPANSDFAAILCRDWERAAQPVTALKTRLCIVRIGVVLDSSGGPLQKMLLPFRLGLGGKIGNGQQWFSWISLDDLCALIFHLIQNKDCAGVFNATAPHPVRNLEFTQLLAERLHRPTLLPVPGITLKAVLGESASLLLGSQKVIPEAIHKTGFVFQHPTLSQALESMIST